MSKRFKLLLVDDDSLVIDFLRETLKEEPYDISEAHSAESALEMIKKEQFHLILSDIRMGGMDGITLLSAIKEINPNLTVIMMTAYGTIDTAVLAMKLGAFDFIMKPMAPDVVKIRLSKAVERITLEREVRTLRIDGVKRYRDIIGKSKAMREIYEKISAAAPSKATILIAGESGTGKEVVARAIHFESDRANGPFVKLNCAALNSNLIESELFGHEKGAFTGAILARTGRFEMADSGTLLLDEISEMPYETQAKLLRALQEQEIERVGAGEPRHVDVRVIASSNRSLPDAIAEGKFREDLFYRLNVIPVEIPPLRNRLEDLPLLVEHFVKKYSEENNREIKQVDESAYEAFMKHSWPGNVRELENSIQAAVVMSRGETITAKDFDFTGKSRLTGPATLTGQKIMFERMSLRELEKHFILERLRSHRGNKTDAAKSLGVASRTIRNKLKEWDDSTNGDKSEFAEFMEDDD